MVFPTGLEIEALSFLFDAASGLLNSGGEVISASADFGNLGGVDQSAAAFDGTQVADASTTGGESTQTAGADIPEPVPSSGDGGSGPATEDPGPPSSGPVITGEEPVDTSGNGSNVTDPDGEAPDPEPEPK